MVRRRQCNVGYPPWCLPVFLPRADLIIRRSHPPRNWCRRLFRRMVAGSTDRLTDVNCYSGSHSYSFPHASCLSLEIELFDHRCPDLVTAVQFRLLMTINCLDQLVFPSACLSCVVVAWGLIVGAVTLSLTTSRGTAPSTKSANLNQVTDSLLETPIKYQFGYLTASG